MYTIDNVVDNLKENMYLKNEALSSSFYWTHWRGSWADSGHWHYSRPNGTSVQKFQLQLAKKQLMWSNIHMYIITVVVLTD